MTATIQQLFSGFAYTSSGGASKGDVITTNDRIAIVQNDIPATKTGFITNDCLALMPKTSGGGTAIADGKKVYWTGSVVTETVSGNTPIGITAAASLDADTTQSVRLQSIDVMKSVTDSSGGTVGTIIAAAAKQTIPIPVGAMSLIADTNTFSVAVPYAATIVAARWITDKPATTANKTTTLTVSTTGGAVTGGAMVLSSTATSNIQTTNTSVAATAMTGANLILTAGQRIIITASATTAIIEGEGHVEVDVTNNDMANALATLAAK